jgi:polysaccharide biosynthesis/export protein
MEYCLPVAGQRAVTFRVLPKKPSINSPYVLGPGDCLQIKLCGGPQSERHPTGADAIGPSEVCEAATVDAPMIGSVPASDLTTDDLKRETATKLADGYVKAPKVAVKILSCLPVYVVGEANHPVSYPCTARSRSFPAVGDRGRHLKARF